MLAVCIRNDAFSDLDGSKLGLTVGKIYDVSLENKNITLFDVVNDDGFKCSYITSRFKLIEELREEKLNDLGI